MCEFEFCILTFGLFYFKPLLDSLCSLALLVLVQVILLLMITVCSYLSFSVLLPVFFLFFLISVATLSCDFLLYFDSHWSLVLCFSLTSLHCDIVQLCLPGFSSLPRSPLS